MWMSTAPTKERLTAMRGTAHGRHTDLSAPLCVGHKTPGSLSQGPNRSGVYLPVLSIVESFPGAMSPLGQGAL